MLPSLIEVFKVRTEAYNSLEDAMQAVNIQKAVAKKEIERHGASWQEFVAEVGDKPSYTGAEVLVWLGY